MVVMIEFVDIQKCVWDAKWMMMMMILFSYKTNNNNTVVIRIVALALTR